MADDPMAGERFLKVVGRRVAGPRSTATELGKPPRAEARAAMTRIPDRAGLQLRFNDRDVKTILPSAPSP